MSVDPKDRQYLIIHNDLDGVISAAIWTLLNPRTRVVGVYDLDTIVLFEDIKLKDNDDLMYLDLDICRKGYTSIGHHFIHKDFKGTPYNPNYFNFVDVITNKYPYSCAFWLIDYYEVPVSSRIIKMLWVVDGSVENYYKYTRNCKWWLKNMLSFPAYSVPTIADAYKDNPLAPYVKCKINSFKELSDLSQVIYNCTGIPININPTCIKTIKLSRQVYTVKEDEILSIVSSPNIFSAARTHTNKLSCTIIPSEVSINEI